MRMCMYNLSMCFEWLWSQFTWDWLLYFVAAFCFLLIHVGLHVDESWCKYLEKNLRELKKKTTGIRPGLHFFKTLDFSWIVSCVFIILLTIYVIWCRFLFFKLIFMTGFCTKPHFKVNRGIKGNLENGLFYIILPCTNLSILKHVVPKKRGIFRFLSISKLCTVTPGNDFTPEIY